MTDERIGSGKRQQQKGTGMVNFPVDNAAWMDTKKGGTFVKLVVMDDRKEGSDMERLGADIRVRPNGELVGDDGHPGPKMPPMAPGETADVSVRVAQQQQDDLLAWNRRHLPSFGEYNESVVQESRGYRAVLLMGEVAWTGVTREEFDPWACSKADLTEEGELLYESIGAAYQGAELALLTYVTR